MIDVASWRRSAIGITLGIVAMVMPPVTVLIIILIVVVSKNDFGAAPTQKAVANISKDVEGEILIDELRTLLALAEQKVQTAPEPEPEKKKPVKKPQV